MQYIQLKEALKDFALFSLSDIKMVDPNFHRRRLNEWQDKGYIKKVIRGYYIFSDVKLNENLLFEIANRIYKPSYISFEMALFYYHLIPESVYAITSASTCRTCRFKTEIAQFTYRTIKPQLFFGYNLVKVDNTYFKIALLEKAILDYFYINSNIKKEEDFAGLRLNNDMFFTAVDEERLDRFLGKFNQGGLTKRIKSFCRFMKNA